MGGRGGMKAAVGAAVALGLLLVGLSGPAPAGAQMQRPGPGGGYYSVPERGWGGERHWRDRDRGGWGDHDRWRHDGWRRDGWRRDGWDHGPYWYGRPGWPRPHGGGWGPGPVYRPGQWLWNGWGWVWVPAY